VTPAKLDPRAIGGYVRAWWQLDENGKVLAGSRPVKVASPSFDPAFPYSETLTWRQSLPVRCVPLVTVAGSSTASAPAAIARSLPVGKPENWVQISLYDAHSLNSAKAAVDVAVIC
jgi:hypothetical protein